MAKTKKQETEVITIPTLAELHQEIMDNIKSVNNAYANNDYKSATTIKGTLKSAIDTYNTRLRQTEYDKWLATDEPVLNALKQKDIEQVRLKDVPVEEGQPPKVALHDKNKRVLVDLVELSAYSGTHGSLFHNGQWVCQCELFAKLIAEKVAEDCNKECKETIRTNFALSDEAKVDDGFNEVPQKLSRTSLKKAGEIILNNILDNGYIFKNEDLDYMLYTVSRQSSSARHTITVPRGETIVRAITEVMVLKVNDGVYGIEFKAARK